MDNKDRLALNLRRRKSYTALKDIIEPAVTLRDFQTVDLATALVMEKSLITYDTGMGKTFMSASFMKIVLRANPGKKFLFICKADQRDQTPKKLSEEVTGLTVGFYDASEHSYNMFKRGDFLNQDIIMLTRQNLNKPSMMKLIFDNREKFIGIILDEVHEYCNYREARNAEMLSLMVPKFKYVLGLTATPVNSAPRQIADILRIINYDDFKDYKKVLNALVNKNNVRLNNTIINRTRTEILTEEELQEVEINNHKLSIEPMPHQLNLQPGDDKINIVKGKGAMNQLGSLYTLIKEKADEGKRGLIYINRKSVTEEVRGILSILGLRIEVINGDVVKNRQKILEEFSNNQYDAIITNLTSSVDIPCDFVVFYELTFEVVQVIGRGYRGFEGKKLDIYYMITKNTFEEEFFRTKVKKRIEEAGKYISKDYSGII